MWNTPDGLRILTSQEWKVFATGLDMLWTLIENDRQQDTEATYTDVEGFESLTHPQKLWILAQVAEALHELSVPAPPDYAYYGAALQAVIKIMQGMLHDEIRDGEFDDNRRALWQAIDGDEMRSWKPKLFENMELQDWDELMHIYEECILEDGDHELAPLVMDKSPKQAAAFKQIMGIDSDYYTAIPPEPTEEMLSQAQATLTRLLRS